MSEFIWMTRINAIGISLGSVTYWRDHELMTYYKKRIEDCEVSSYCGFNADQLVLLIESKSLQMTDLQLLYDMRKYPLGLELCQDVGELTYVKRQDDHSNINQPSILYSVSFDVPDEWTREFDDWYETEHIPMIYDCKHWAMTKRYRMIRQPQGSTSTHLALHHLTDAAGMDAPELKAARLTPWRNKLIQQPWFTSVKKMIYFRQGIPS